MLNARPGQRRMAIDVEIRLVHGLPPWVLRPTRAWRPIDVGSPRTWSSPLMPSTASSVRRWGRSKDVDVCGEVGEVPAELKEVHREAGRAGGCLLAVDLPSSPLSPTSIHEVSLRRGQRRRVPVHELVTVVGSHDVEGCGSPCVMTQSALLLATSRERRSDRSSRSATSTAFLATACRAGSGKGPPTHGSLASRSPDSEMTAAGHIEIDVGEPPDGSPCQPRGPGRASRGRRAIVGRSYLNWRPA